MSQLSLDHDEQLLCEALERFCQSEGVLARAQASQGELDEALWRTLCAQGYLELAAPAEGMSLRMVVVLVEVLGRHALPGPLTDTVLALSVVHDEEARALLAGEVYASVASPPLAPLATRAGMWFEVTHDSVFRLAREGAVTPRTGLGAEAWGEAKFTRTHRCEGAKRALVIYDVALAAQLAALASGLVKRTAEHAATRKQFGKPIGAFQAVSHPLADAHIALTAATMLARAAACAFDDGTAPRARALATAALVSAHRAALESVYVCHQKLGALGITLEGPAHHVSRRVRTLATRAQGRVEATRELLLRHAGVAS